MDEIVNNEAVTQAPESSVPVGAFAQKTRGRQPRSREASSREAMSRTNEIDLAHFEKIFKMEQQGSTYMSPDAVPPGYTGMWVRTSVYGNTDHSNVSRMMYKGWIPPSSDNFPKESFLNTFGDITDDKGILERPGLVWMLRPLSVHNLEMKVQQEKLNASRNYIEAARKIGIDGGFVTGRGNFGQNVTFTGDAQAQYVASMFGH